MTLSVRFEQGIATRSRCSGCCERAAATYSPPKLAYAEAPTLFFKLSNAADRKSLAALLLIAEPCFKRRRRPDRSSVPRLG